MNSAALREAIYDQFAGVQTAGSIYALTGGRLRYGRPSHDNFPMPYVLYAFLSDAPDNVFGGIFADLRVSFTCWDERAQTNIDALGAALRTRFDDCTLTFSGGELSHVDMTRALHVGPTFVADEAGGGAWRDVTDYMVKVKE